MIEDIKHCVFCKTDKPFFEFNKSKRGRFGLHNHCRSCQKIVRRNWYLLNCEKEKAKNRTPEYKEKVRIRNKKRYYEDLEWRDKQLELNRKRRREEKSKIKARKQRNEWVKNPHNRIACNLRSRIRIALKGIGCIEKSEKLLGISFEDFKIYLEKNFQDNMSWDNYGEWHMDHIIPCDFFDLTKEEHRRICFYYKNIKPMWGKENISKNNKITIDNFELFLEEIKKDLNLSAISATAMGWVI